MNPPKEKEKMNQLFMTMGMIDTKDGTIYADLMGTFPITSMNGIQAVFIMYDWTTNEVLATLIKDATSETIMKSFKENIAYLAKRGFKPVCYVDANAATNAVKEYLKSEDINVQFFTPLDHREHSRITPFPVFASVTKTSRQYYGAR